jgi:hypothetical protein
LKTFICHSNVSNCQIKTDKSDPFNIFKFNPLAYVISDAFSHSSFPRKKKACDYRANRLRPKLLSCCYFLLPSDARSLVARPLLQSPPLILASTDFRLSKNRFSQGTTDGRRRRDDGLGSGQWRWKEQRSKGDRWHKELEEGGQSTIDDLRKRNQEPKRTKGPLS